MAEIQKTFHSSSQVSDFMQQMTYLSSLIININYQAPQYRLFHEMSVL